MFSKIKALFEATLRCKIYRNSLPKGIDIFHDLEHQHLSNTFKTVFDIGANEGQTTRLFQEHFEHATIHAFEPVSNLADRIMAKGFLKPSTQLHRIALGDAPRKATISVRNNQTSSLIYQPNETHDYQEEIEIATLDQFARDAKISHIDFLKIDAEGFDLNVLKGGSGMLADGKVDFVQVEAGFSQHWRLVPFCSFLSYLQPLGYELFGVYEQVQHWTGEPWLLCANAVFIRRELR